MVSNILYTDIKQHFKLKQDFELYWKKNEEKSTQEPGSPKNNNEQYQQQVELLTGMIIHTADFNGAAKKFVLARKWSERVNKEFH